MAMAEETETRGLAELDDMVETRKEIHLKQGAIVSDIFGYQNTAVNNAGDEETNQVALAITEDRRKNISQFDLAYIDVGGEEVLAAFDTCSTATLIHRELVDEGKLKVTETTNNANINGIGGIARGKVVELELESRNGEKTIVITATVVDEIMNLQKKHGDRFNQLTRESANTLSEKEGFGKITENNFQQVPGGKIQMLLGQNVGQDFFPKEIATFTCGLKVSIHQIKLYNEKRYLGFSGRFPAQFTTMYTTDDHPRALVIQEFPQRFEHEEETVFREGASAGTQR